MCVEYLLSFLLTTARLVVTSEANEFMRRMKLRHVLSLAVIISGFSCSANIETPHDLAEQENKLAPQTPYPNPVVKEEPQQQPASDPWQCGYEWIVVEGPQGELIMSQVPLPCDPHADFYQGCPSVLDSE
jgi:hypothetical protein